MVNPGDSPCTGQACRCSNFKLDLCRRRNFEGDEEDCIVHEREEACDNQGQRNDYIDKNAYPTVESIMLSDAQIDKAEAVPSDRECELFLD